MSRPEAAVNHCAVTLRIPRELVSPNVWNGRHWRVKHRLSQDWEAAIGKAIADLFYGTFGRVDFPNALSAFIGPKKWVGFEPGRMRVAITREVPSGRNFIRDDDNLRFCVKPLLDALKRQGYIKNDSRKWIELPMPEQRVSTDGQHWTVIALQALADPSPTSADQKAVSS